MFDFLKDLDSKIEAAKPHFRHGLTKADAYACRIIDLLEDIADDDTPAEDQRVKRFNLVNGAAQQFETPQGADWKLVAIAVEPAGATTVTLRMGGVTRFAQQFAAAGTPQVPATVIPAGATLDVLSTGADAVVTVIAQLKRKRGKLARGTTGDQMDAGLPGANEFEPSRHYTDEAVHIDTPNVIRPSGEYEDDLVQGIPEPDRNSEPVY